jgi:cellulose biosynthesis protein BcsQ
VGKTTAAVNLAHAAASHGLRVVLWDLDPQGSASFYLRIAPRLPGGTRTVIRKSVALADHVRPTDFDNLRALPSDFSLRFLDRELDTKKRPHRRLTAKIRPLAHSFDLVFLDCAPSVSVVSEAVIHAADAVIVPVIPSTLSVRALDQVRRVVDAVNHRSPRVLPFLSMVDRRRRMHLEIAADCLADADFLPTAIPYSSEVEKMGSRRAPVTASRPSHPAAAAFRSLWGEIATRVGVG